MPRPRWQVVLTWAVRLVLALVVGTLFSALVVPMILATRPAARRETTIVQMRMLIAELEKYRIDNSGRAPSTEQGLEALVGEPTAPPKPTRWKGPYIEQVPEDGWGSDYQYASLDGGRDFRVWSLGADGAEGGVGLDADIRSWVRETWAEE